MSPRKTGPYWAAQLTHAGANRPLERPRPETASVSRSNPAAVWSFVLALISLPTFILWGAGAGIGIAAVVLGLLGVRRAYAGARLLALAYVGIALGSIGAIIGAVFIYFLVSCPDLLRGC